jgi:hypothetical protein
LFFSQTIYAGKQHNWKHEENSVPVHRVLIGYDVVHSRPNGKDRRCAHEPQVKWKIPPGEKRVTQQRGKDSDNLQTALEFAKPVCGNDLSLFAVTSRKPETNDFAPNKDDAENGVEHVVKVIMIKAEQNSSLSAIGSMNLPKLVTRFRLRAI